MTVQLTRRSNMASMEYDVIVVGAGIVGCAMVREFARQGAKVLLLEKASDILDGASKGNSAILHTGFDAPTGSIELECIKLGYQEYHALSQDHGLDIDKCGAMVVAWNEKEAEQLSQIVKKAHENGIVEVGQLTQKDIRHKEPNLSTKALSAISVPNEYIIDPWTSAYSYLQEAIDLGAKVLTNAEVTDGHYVNHQWQVVTSIGEFHAKAVINCAGLYGDSLDKTLIQQSFFTIKPRKGEFIVYDKSASDLINAIILPVPNEITKGIVVCRTIFGNVLVGPTAEEQNSRDDASVKESTLIMLKEKAEDIVPSLKDMAITATYAGIRPATEYKDYCINALENLPYISVGGIRSTGLSAALGIAKYVFKQYQVYGFDHQPKPIKSISKLSVLAEKGHRDWQKKGNKGIVCHCEWVTNREIEQALTGDLAVKSLAGLKRRTRVTMGRCQGFYCSAELAKITKNNFPIYDKSSNDE